MIFFNYQSPSLIFYLSLLRCFRILLKKLLKLLRLGSLKLEAFCFITKLYLILRRYLNYYNIQRSKSLFYVVVYGVIVYQKLFKDLVMYENLLILFILFYIRPYVKAKIKKVQYFFFENKH